MRTAIPRGQQIDRKDAYSKDTVGEIGSLILEVNVAARQVSDPTMQEWIT